MSKDNPSVGKYMYEARWAVGSGVSTSFYTVMADNEFDAWRKAEAVARGPIASLKYDHWYTRKYFRKDSDGTIVEVKGNE